MSVIDNLFLVYATELKQTLKNRCYLFNKRVLELGPFAGHHTYALQKMGAREIISIEGRKENYDNCIKNKELYDMNKCNFLLGDIEKIDLDKLGYFDFVLMMGILHHLINPVKTIKTLSTITDIICIGTRLATDENIDGLYTVSNKVIDCEGYKGKMNVEPKQNNVGLNKFGVWLYKEELIRLLNNVKFNYIQIIHENDSALGNNLRSKYIMLLAFKNVFYINTDEVYGDYEYFVPHHSNYEELKENIRKNGILEPIDVSKFDNGASLYINLSSTKGKYLIIDGGHRCKIAKDLGIKTLPCRIAKKEMVEACLWGYLAKDWFGENAG